MLERYNVPSPTLTRRAVAALPLLLEMMPEISAYSPAARLSRNLPLLVTVRSPYSPLTVIMRSALVFMSRGLTRVTTLSEVCEPKRRFWLFNPPAAVVPAQSMTVTASLLRVTVRGAPLAAKPPAPTHCTLPAAVPIERVKVPLVSSTATKLPAASAPLNCKLLAAGRLVWFAVTCTAPPEMMVGPV